MVRIVKVHQSFWWYHSQLGETLMRSGKMEITHIPEKWCIYETVGETLTVKKKMGKACEITLWT